LDQAAANGPAWDCKLGLVLGAISIAGSSLACADELPSPQAVAFFAGVATNTNFTDSMVFPWSNDLVDISVVGASYSQRVGTFDGFFGDDLAEPLNDHFSFEVEAGVSMRFGSEDLAEAWTGLYLRYDGFGWNDKVYTTIAVNTGLSVLSDISDFELSRDKGDNAAQLLHYMGPEVTFANPANKDLEFLLRFHHRSGVFGLFDGVVSGSTFISSGFRLRF
jgi:hypothetical protein